MAEIFYCAKKSITLLIYLEVLRANFAKLSFLGSMADPGRLQNDRLNNDNFHHTYKLLWFLLLDALSFLFGLGCYTWKKQVKMRFYKRPPL